MNEKKNQVAKALKLEQPTGAAPDVQADPTDDTAEAKPPNHARVNSRSRKVSTVRIRRDVQLCENHGKT